MTLPKFEVGDRIVVVWDGTWPHDQLLVDTSGTRQRYIAIELPIRGTVRLRARQGGEGQWLYQADLDTTDYYDGWFDEDEIERASVVDVLGEIR